MTSKVIFSFLPKKKVILSGMGFIGFLIFVLLIRLTFLSSIYYANGVEALKSGDRDKAFLSYTWAVRNYYPGNPFIQKSVLGALGIIQAESLEGKKKLEIIHLKDLRAVIYSIRYVFQPCKDSLQLVEDRLKRLHDEQTQ